MQTILQKSNFIAIYQELAMIGIYSRIAVQYDVL